MSMSVPTAETGVGRASLIKETKDPRPFIKGVIEAAALCPSLADLVNALNDPNSTNPTVKEAQVRLVEAATLALVWQNILSPTAQREGPATSFSTPPLEFIRAQLIQRDLDPDKISLGARDAVTNLCQNFLGDQVGSLTGPKAERVTNQVAQSAFKVLFQNVLLKAQRSLTRYQQADLNHNQRQQANLELGQLESLLETVAREGDYAAFKQAARQVQELLFAPPAETLTLMRSATEAEQLANIIVPVGPKRLLLESRRMPVGTLTEKGKVTWVSQLTDKVLEEVRTKFLWANQKAYFDNLSPQQQSGLAVLAVHLHDSTQNQVSLLLNDPTLVSILNDLPVEVQSQFSPWAKSCAAAAILSQSTESYAMETMNTMQRFAESWRDPNASTTDAAQTARRVLKTAALGGATWMVLAACAGGGIIPPTVGATTSPTGTQTATFTPLPPTATATVTATPVPDHLWQVSQLAFSPITSMNGYSSEFLNQLKGQTDQINEFIKTNPLCAKGCNILIAPGEQTHFFVSLTTPQGAVLYPLLEGNGSFDFANSEWYVKMGPAGTQWVYFPSAYFDRKTGEPRKPVTDAERFASQSFMGLVNDGNVLAVNLGPFDGGSGKFRVVDEATTLGIDPVSKRPFPHLDGYAFVVFFRDDGSMAGAYYQLSAATENKGDVLLGVPTITSDKRYGMYVSPDGKNWTVVLNETPVPPTVEPILTENEVAALLHLPDLPPGQIYTFQEDAVNKFLIDPNLGQIAKYNEAANKWESLAGWRDKLLSTKDQFYDYASDTIRYERIANGYLFTGVLDEMPITEPVNIMNRDGKTKLGESTLTLRFYYLDADQKLQSVLVPRIIKTADDITFVVGYDATRQFSYSGWRDTYSGRKGVPIFPMVYTDIDAFYARLYDAYLQEGLEDQAIKSPADKIPWQYNFLKAYIAVWNADFVKAAKHGRLPAGMTVLIPPLEFASGSLSEPTIIFP